MCVFLDIGLHGLFIYEMVDKHVCSRSVALYASCTPEIHGALMTHDDFSFDSCELPIVIEQHRTTRWVPTVPVKNGELSKVGI